MKVQLTKAIRMFPGKILKAGTIHEFDEPFARELMANERAVEVVPKAAKKEPGK
jgi:hypothetical protein